MTPETFQSQQQIPPLSPFEEDTVSILDILLVLAKNIKLIIVTPTIFCIITIIYVLFIANPTYVSKATFMSSGASDNKSQMMGLASQFGIAMPMDDSSPKWSYEEVINSRNMAKSLLSHRFNTKEFGFQKELLQILTYGNQQPEFGVDTLTIQGIKSISDMIDIRKTESLFELEISAFEPQLAADIASAVLVELDLHQQNHNAKITTETRRFIDERLLGAKAELEIAEEALKIFRERNRSTFESPQLQLEQERLARDVAVLISVYTTLKQQLETAKIEEIKESDYVIILDTPNKPLYPYKPKKKRRVIFVGLFGIGLGMIFAFIKEYAENSDREEQDKRTKLKKLILNNISSLLPKILRRI